MVRALVVDDSKVDQRLAGSLLSRRADLEVTCADNGREAMEMIRREPPDLIVTDMQMPELDGLALVEAVRKDYPTVPVILMTAHGSEDVAAEALRRGASSYVPKRLMSRDLAPTAEQVLAVAGVERQQYHALEFLTQTQSDFELDNDPAHIHPIIRYLRQDLERMRLCDETAMMRIGVALDEAISNAMLHGNLEIDADLRELAGEDLPAVIAQRRTEPPHADRRVHLSARVSRTEAVYTVRDEGPGFDFTVIGQERDPASIERGAHRGLLLIRTFMDEVRHNARGNEITMIKRRDLPETEAHDESAGGRRQPGIEQAASAPPQ